MDSKKLYSKICEELITKYSRSLPVALTLQYSVEGMTPKYIKQRLEKKDIHLSRHTINNHRRKYAEFIKELKIKQ